MRTLIAALLSLSVCASAQSYRDLLGTGISSSYEGSSSRMWVDIGRSFRTPQNGGSNAAVDAAGWPTTDFNTVIFHVQPC